MLHGVTELIYLMDRYLSLRFRGMSELEKWWVIDTRMEQ